MTETNSDAQRANRCQNVSGSRSTAITQADRLFFERLQDRQHRGRPQHQA